MTTHRDELHHLIEQMPDVQVDVMLADARRYSESAVGGAELSDAQKALIRRRAAELEADPSLGLSWNQLDARLKPRWG